MAGEGLPLVGRLLGHRGHRTTAGYAHLADAHLVEAAEKFGAVIAATMDNRLAGFESRGQMHAKESTFSTQKLLFYRKKIRNEHINCASLRVDDCDRETEMKYIVHAILASALFVYHAAAAEDADASKKLCLPVSDLERELIVVCVEQCLHHKRYGAEIGERFRHCVTRECKLAAPPRLRAPGPPECDPSKRRCP